MTWQRIVQLLYKCNMCITLTTHITNMTILTVKLHQFLEKLSNMRRWKLKTTQKQHQMQWHQFSAHRIPWESSLSVPQICIDQIPYSPFCNYGVWQILKIPIYIQHQWIVYVALDVSRCIVAIVIQMQTQ